MRARLWLASALAALLVAAPALATILDFGGGDIELRINASTNNYDICTAAQALGCPTCNVSDSKVRVILANGVVVGSTSTSTLAMQTGNCGSAWGTGWTVHVVVEGTDSARIQGKGGGGGNGQANPTADPSGGGGGGAGTQVGAGGTGGPSSITSGEDGDPGTVTAGGSGGAVGINSGEFTVSATNGGAGGGALRASSSGPDIEIRPESGATLEVWGGGGGGGGGGRTGAAGGLGGNGGGPGIAGSNGGGSSAFGTGGAAGLGYSTSDATITEIGPGTIDCRGGGC